MEHQNQHIDESVLMKFLLGESPQEEMDSVRRWLDLSADNQRMLDNLETIWLESGKLIPVPVAVDVDLAWGRMNERMESWSSGNSKVRKLQPLKIITRIAAMLVVASGLYLLYWFVQRPGMEVQMADVAPKEVRLNDSSTVTLNADSKITYVEDFGKKQRKLKLEGEAFFKVSPDKEKPFIIDAAGGMVRVVGTSFNVNARSDSAVWVNVESGIVMLQTIESNTGDTLSLALTAGEKGWYKAGIQPEKELIMQVDELFWLDKTLIFKNTTVAHFIETLSKYYSDSVSVEDSSINNCVFTANFHDVSVEYMVGVVATTLGLEMESTEKGYLLKGNGCAEDEN